MACCLFLGTRARARRAICARRAWRTAGPAIAWLAALAGGAYALRHPAPLVADFGAGDEALASGFAEGWVRYDVRGPTTFRWTGEVATVALPMKAVGRDVSVEVRLARFAEHATPITLTAPGRTIATWRQHPVGWRLRRFPVGAWDGDVSLGIQAPASEGEPAGIAVDWCAWHGVESVWPTARVWLGLLAWLVAAPFVAGLVLRRQWLLAYGSPLLLVCLSLWATHDTVAALTTASLAGPRVLVACALALPLALWLGRRADAPAAATQRAFVWAPLCLIVIALTALSNPRYHYPDVDTHARFLAGMRARPGWALDPREYQQDTRAWTRLIGGRYVGFPYSATFHVLAWPLAPVLGDTGAVKTMAVLAAALGLAFVYRLARAIGASPRVAVLGQAFFAIMPVVPSRLTLALLPSLLGQAMELWLLLALATRLHDLSRWHERAAAFLLLFAVQLSYTGSLFNVAMVVLLWVASKAASRRWRSAVWWLAAYALAALAVALVQYRYFVPTLLEQVAPYLASASAAPDVAKYGTTPLLLLTRSAARLWVFFGPFGLVLALVGWLAIGRKAAPARRVLFTALAAGLLLVALRPAVPALFADAKEVELLAGPMAIAAALGAARLWSLDTTWRGVRVALVAWRSLSVALVAALLTWSAMAAWERYASRLTGALGG